MLGLSTVGLWLLSVSFFAWALMSVSYLPILRRYRVSYLFALLLPISAMLYTGMTVSSALRYWLHVVSYQLAWPSIFRELGDHEFCFYLSANLLLFSMFQLNWCVSVQYLSLSLRFLSTMSFVSFPRFTGKAGHEFTADVVSRALEVPFNSRDK